MSNNSIKVVCEFFWNIENKYKLLDQGFSDWPVWEYSRMFLYYDLLIRLNIGDTPHVMKTSAPENYVKRVNTFFKTWVTRNPFLRFTQCDILIFEHRRVQPLGNKQIDIYSYFLECEFDSKNINWRSLTSPWGEKYCKEDKPQRLHTHVLLRLTQLLRRLPFSFSKKEYNVISKINIDAEKAFKIQWNVGKLMLYHGKELKILTLLFIWLFKLWRPKEIYVIVGYEKFNAAAILAAHKCQIPVIELQHGTISRYHLGYSFPERTKKLKCFPDKLLVWNDMWKKSIPFSPKVAKTEIRQFDWLQRKKHQYTKITKRKAVLVISQGLLGNQIAEEFLKVIRQWKDWDIRYKLHPGEYTRWENYPALSRLKTDYGVTVLEGCDLYQEMAQCMAQVGVFSTAIYEGIEFGCKTFLLDLPGLEYMQDLIDTGEAEVLRSDNR